MTTQWQDEWKQIVAKRIEDEGSGKREPHIPIREHFTYLIHAMFWGATAAIALIALVLLLIFL